MSCCYLSLLLRDKLLEFLEEDLFFGDSLKLPNKIVEAEIFSKDEGIVAGIEVLKALFDMVDVEVANNISDGSEIKFGDKIVELRGNSKDIFAVERTALNILMRMSGIATTVKKMLKKARKVNPNVIIAGTRKTTPGFRIFEKLAIEIGGGDTHRYSLWDCVMIKHSHISLIGLEKSIELAKNSSFTKKIEVEVKSIKEAIKVAKMGVDIIMLDNMSPSEIEEIVNCIDKLGLRDNLLVEASGGINPDNVAEYARTGVDIISTGFITHSSRWLDFSFRISKLS